MAVAGFIFLQANIKRVHELNEVAFERYRFAGEIIAATQTAHRLLLKALSVAANETDQRRLSESIQVSFAADEKISNWLQQLEEKFPSENLSVQIRPAFETYRSAAKDVLDVAQSDPASATLLTFAPRTEFEPRSRSFDKRALVAIHHFVRGTRLFDDNFNDCYA
jgi:hypothetical protein